MNKTLFGLIMILFTGSQTATARDFGQKGTVFAVKEEGFVAMIKRKLAALNLEEQQIRMRNLAQTRVENPTPIAGISKSEKLLSWSYDPSYQLEEDIYLPNGKLLYLAGTKVNPLEQMNWDGKLIFIDSRDEEQLKWLEENWIKTVATTENEIEIAKDEAVKIVLVAGRPLDLERKLNRPIYFDQFGELTSKFGISHVPATVEQEGKYLKVTEFCVE